MFRQSWRLFLRRSSCQETWCTSVGAARVLYPRRDVSCKRGDAALAPALRAGATEHRKREACIGSHTRASAAARGPRRADVGAAGRGLHLTGQPPPTGQSAARYLQAEADALPALDPHGLPARVVPLSDSVAQRHAALLITIGAPKQPPQATRLLLGQVRVESAGTWGDGQLFDRGSCAMRRTRPARTVRRAVDPRQNRRWSRQSGRRSGKEHSPNALRGPASVALLIGGCELTEPRPPPRGPRAAAPRRGKLGPRSGPPMPRRRVPPSAPARCMWVRRRGPPKIAPRRTDERRSAPGSRLQSGEV